MRSGERLMTSGRDTARGSTKGVVLVAHGGQASSTAPTSALQPAVLRMIPVAAAIRHGAAGERRRGAAATFPGPRLERRARPPRSAT